MERDCIEMDHGRLKVDGKLKKFELDYSLSYDYFYDCLHNVNELSTKVIDIVNFHEGKFFTFLSEDINNNQLHQFKHWDVAKYAKAKATDLIFKLIKNYPEISVIFDDFDSEFPKISDQALFLDCGFHYKKEVYYSIDKETVSKEKLKDCFYVSDILWHSLCVLSKIRFDKKNQELSDAQINDICLNAKLILVEAYDGESYIFWKRNDFMICELLEADFVSAENQDS